MAPRQSSGKVTIKDVARACGVSTQTISRVINDRSDVSEATREKVLAVIDQMGYQPNALARGMRSLPTTIGVILSGLRYKGISITLKGIARAAEARGFSLILKELPSFGADNIKPVIHSLMSHQVRGIIYASPQVGDNWSAVCKVLGNTTPPMVFLKGSPAAAPATISIDNYMGGYMAARHLVEQGFGCIAHIGGPQGWWESAERKRGWEQALRDAGQNVDSRMFVEGDWSPASGLAAYETLRVNCPSLDAIFAANDQMALGVLHGAQRDGLLVPGSLGVAGYDDLSEAAYYNPPLTTVRQDFHLLGELAVRKLLLLAGLVDRDAEVESGALILEPGLVVRESSRCIRK